MKVFETTRPLSLNEVKSFLDAKLNAIFQQRRQVSLHFNITANKNSLILTNENYEDPLFRLEFKGNTIELNKSEHYTDDVNAIALESTLGELFENFPSDDNIDYVSGQN